MKIASIVGLAFGAIFVVAGIVTWIVITSTLSSQKITVSDGRQSSSLAPQFAGLISAYCQASVIEEHTMEITSGKTLPESCNDHRPNRVRRTPSSSLQDLTVHLW